MRQLLRRRHGPFKSSNKNGGEEGIRTLDTGSPYTPLAGERLRPLGHLSTAVDSEGRHPFQAELDHGACVFSASC